MEIKAQLLAPYTEEERELFIVNSNHRLGYEIRRVEREIIDEETEEVIETVIDLQAWGYTDEELLTQAKENKNEENTAKAKEAIENGYVVYKDAEFETNAQTVGDLTATMLLMQATGMETYIWLSRDDKVVELSLEDFGTLGGLIAQYKNNVWSNKYLDFKQQIALAETLEEVNAIVIDYEAE